MRDYLTGNSILPFAVEECLRDFIQAKFVENGLHDAFPNSMLREDVLSILDRFCTVVYYPLEQETDNNGFRLMGVPVAGELDQNFVFINTAQTLEKQVFTAAHELGHIWEADTMVISQKIVPDTPDNREKIINRFAAIILMPKDIFINAFEDILRQEDHTGTTITLNKLLRIVVKLMGIFFAPYKAVVLRLRELECVSEQVVNILLGGTSPVKKTIQEVLPQLLSEYGLVQFQNPTNKKWIEGLADLLDAAEKTDAIPDVKVKRMREKFGLEPRSRSEEMEKEIEFYPKESDEKPCS